VVTVNEPPPRRGLCDHCGLSVIRSACVQDYCKINQPISLKTWYYDCAYQSQELINFWWWSGPGYGFRIIFPLPSPLQNRKFYIFISTSHTIAARFSRHSAKRLTPTRYPKHFGSDLADIRVLIWINPEIRIRMPDHFWLRV